MLDREGLAEAAQPCDGVLLTLIEAVAETTQGGSTELLAGSDALEEQIGAMRVRISSEAFFQTNTEMAERLYALAREYAEPERERPRV